MSLEKVFPVFAAAFAVIYLLAVQMNWALFTYHPKLGEWDWLVQPAPTGPPKYWDGWRPPFAPGATAVRFFNWPLLPRSAAPLSPWGVVPLGLLLISAFPFPDFF